MTFLRAIKRTSPHRPTPAMFHSTRRVLSVFMLVVILLSQVVPLAPAQAQDPVGNLITRMSAEERVGQLFLVTFTGTDAGPQSPIYDLITNYHVGGVVLTRANDNFIAAPDTTLAAHLLVSA